MTVSGETTVRVRYAETDQMGVVYYANFFVWFEVARVELMRQLGETMEVENTPTSRGLLDKMKEMFS